jgi:hypothetical protein
MQQPAVSTYGMQMSNSMQGGYGMQQQDGFTPNQQQGTPNMPMSNSMQGGYGMQQQGGFTPNQQQQVHGGDTAQMQQQMQQMQQQMQQMQQQMQQQQRGQTGSLLQQAAPGGGFHQQKDQQGVPPSGLWISATMSRLNGPGTEQHHYVFGDDGSITGEAYNIEWNRKVLHDPFWSEIRGKWDRDSLYFEYSEVSNENGHFITNCTAKGEFTDASMRVATVKLKSMIDTCTATITFSRQLTDEDRKAAGDAKGQRKATDIARNQIIQAGCEAGCVIS